MFLWWKSCCSCKVQEVKDGRISSRIGTSWIENSVNVYFFSSNNHFSKKLQSNSDVFLLKKSFEMYENHFLQVQNHPFKNSNPPKKILPCFFVFPPQLFPMEVVILRFTEVLGQGRSERWATDGSWLAILIHEFHVNHQPRVVVGTQGVPASGNPKDGWETYPLEHLRETERKTPWGRYWKNGSEIPQSQPPRG